MAGVRKKNLTGTRAVAQDECRGVLKAGRTRQEGIIELPHNLGLVPRIGMFPHDATQPIGDCGNELAMSGDIGDGNPGYEPLTADGEIVEIPTSYCGLYWLARHPRGQAR
jgi:hypothetical protein